MTDLNQEANNIEINFLKTIQQIKQIQHKQILSINQIFSSIQRRKSPEKSSKILPKRKKIFCFMSNSRKEKENHFCFILANILLKKSEEFVSHSGDQIFPKKGIFFKKKRSSRYLPPIDQNQQ